MLLKIFSAALAIRWIYALLLFAMMGDAGLQAPDSNSYIADAQALARTFEAVSCTGPNGWV